MKLLPLSCITLSCFVLASQAMAQVPSDAIKQGTVLNASGIQLSGFGKAMPLPPGNWEVVRRTDTEIKLTGEGPSVAPVVDLVLRNTDASAPLAAVMLAYTPEAIRIRWKSNVKCEDPNANLVDDHGTTAGSLTYACSISYVNKEGFKKFVTNAPSHTNDWVKTHLSPLVPFVADIPDRNIWSSLRVNRDRGRNIEIAFIARSNSAPWSDDPLNQSERAWIKSTGKAYIDILEGNASWVQPFPVAVTSSAP